MVIINQYFEKKRGLANGIALSGSGIGSMAIPPLMLYTLDSYGLEGTLIVMGGIALNLCVCGMLFRPAKFYLRRHCLNMGRQLSLRKAVLGGSNDRSCVVSNVFDRPTCEILEITFRRFDDPICSRESPRKEPLQTNGASGERSSNYLNPVPMVHLPGNSIKVQNKDDATAKLLDIHHPEKTGTHGMAISAIDIGYHSPTGATSRPTADINDNTFRSESQPWFVYHLFTNPMFLIYAVSITISVCTYIDMFIMATPHAEDLGFSSTKAAMTISIMGLTDTVSRVGFGIFADFNIVKKQHIFHASLALSSAVFFVIPSMKTYGTYTFVCVLFSFAGAGYKSITPPLLVESFGIERFPTAYGMVMQFVACGHLFIPVSMGTY